jgi:hypothetical protein
VEQVDGCGAYALQRLAVATPYNNSLYAFATSSSGQICAPYIRDSNVGYYLPGAEVPAAPLPALTTTLEGDGRLKVYAFASATGQRVDLVPSLSSTPILHDSQRNEPCFARGTAQGLSCFPVRWQEPRYFRDSQLTVPVFTQPRMGDPSKCDSVRPNALAMYGFRRPASARPTWCGRSSRSVPSIPR